MERKHFEEQFKKIIQRAKDLDVELQTDLAVGRWNRSSTA